MDDSFGRSIDGRLGLRSVYQEMERALAVGWTGLFSPELAQLAGHPDWRVRYAAAVGMGESRSAVWLPLLEAMLLYEDSRSLYSQPRVSYRNSYDDTRMAEQLVPIEVVFDQPYPEDLKEDWRCRGRVKQACLFAIAGIGLLTGSLTQLLQDYLTKPAEDSQVGAAAALALGRAGGADSLAILEQAGLKADWCLQTEVAKADRLIRLRMSAEKPL